MDAKRILFASSMAAGIGLTGLTGAGIGIATASAAPGFAGASGIPVLVDHLTGQDPVCVPGSTDPACFPAPSGGACLSCNDNTFNNGGLPPNYIGGVPPGIPGVSPGMPPA